MKKHIDITGQRFGLLVVQGRAEPAVARRDWRCACDCGAETNVSRNYLLTSPCPSCGCEDRRRKSARFRKHGATTGRDFTLSYWTWRGMKSRCYVESDTMYGYYGGRGITICPRWMVFSNFIADMGERPSRAHTIERVDTNGNYEPGNCRWATRVEQMRNMRRNVYVETPEGRVLVADLARRFGFEPKILARWKRWGWTDERIYQCALAGPIPRGAKRGRPAQGDGLARASKDAQHTPLVPA